MKLVDRLIQLGKIKHKNLGIIYVKVDGSTDVHEFFLDSFMFTLHGKFLNYEVIDESSETPGNEYTNYTFVIKKPKKIKPSYINERRFKINEHLGYIDGMSVLLKNGYLNSEDERKSCLNELKKIRNDLVKLLEFYE